MRSVTRFDADGGIRVSTGAAAGKFLKSNGSGDVSWASIAAHFFIPASAMWPSLTSGCKNPTQVEQATNKGNNWFADFIDGSTTYAECTAVMPADFDAGTVTAQFYWTSTNAGTLVARWQLEGGSFSDGDALDAAFGTAQAVDDAMASTANQVRISAATSAMTIAGSPAAGDLAQFRIGRLGGHANDTLTVDARLLGVLINYTRA